MAREEQIEHAAYDYLCDDKSYVALLESKGFIEGAKWADEHPREGLVDIEKVCKFLDGYSFIPTYVINELKQAMEGK